MGCSDVTGVIVRSMATERVQEDADFTASDVVVLLESAQDWQLRDKPLL
jgi:hypothetical protein